MGSSWSENCAYYGTYATGATLCSPILPDFLVYLTNSPMGNATHAFALEASLDPSNPVLTPIHVLKLATTNFPYGIDVDPDVPS